MRRWMPDEHYPSAFAIPWTQLRARGVCAVLLDLDNTLGPWGVQALDPQAQALLHDLRVAGFSVGILSNAKRVHLRTTLMQQLQGLPIVFPAQKPSTKGFARLLRQLGSPAPHATVMVGDQWCTDILGAKRAGIRAVLIDPFDPASEPWWARVRRALTDLILRSGTRSLT